LSKEDPGFYGIDVMSYTLFTYDGLSRVTQEAHLSGRYTNTYYRGLEKDVYVAQTSTTGAWTTSTYDVYQRLRRTEDNDHTYTDYTYDTLGNLIQVIAASNISGLTNTTTMTYDSLSKKKTMNDPDMGTWTYLYDKAGNLVCQRDAKLQTIGFFYDAINRMTDKKYYGSGVDCTNYLSATPLTNRTITNTYVCLHGPSILLPV
jgi:YD repeat-containing protein